LSFLKAGSKNQRTGCEEENPGYEPNISTVFVTLPAELFSLARSATQDMHSVSARDSKFYLSIANNRI
jgi:hypothetical protein